MTKRRTGLNNLAYMGVEALTPPNVGEYDRSPTASDYTGHNIGDFWIYQKDQQEVWMLTNKAAKVSTWVQLDQGGEYIFEELTVDPGDLTISSLGVGTARTNVNGVVSSLADGVDLDVYMGRTGDVPHWGELTSTGGTVAISKTVAGINLESAGGTSATTFEGDDGLSISPDGAGNVNVFGGVNINTTAAIANTVTINLDNGTQGQVLIGSNAGNSAWANITSSDASVTINEGNNTIDLTNAGAIGANLSEIIWQDRINPFDSTIGVAECVEYGNGEWVAGGRNGAQSNLSYSTGNPFMFNSVVSPFGPGETVYGVSYGNSLWVAVSIYFSNYPIATSVTASGPWTLRANPSTDTLYDVHYGNGLWVTVGDTGRLMTSPDGITWTDRVSSFGTTRIRAVHYGSDGNWVAVGAGKLATSPDGITWTQILTLAFGILYDVFYGNGLWVAVGGTNVITTSPDAITWTNRDNTLASGNVTGVAYGNGKWTAVTERCQSTTSVDGITWRQGNYPFRVDKGALAVSFGDGYFCCVGWQGSLSSGE